MGLETAPQQSLGRIDPSSIVAKADPTITPSAIEQLSNSVKTGFITAEDIKARLQANPALTEQQKLAAMIAKEGQSPEAQSVRAGATHLAGSDIEAKEAQIKYGPAIQYFQELAPTANVPTPMTDAGKPDYAKMAELGSKLYSWKVQRQTAVDRLTPTTWKEAVQNGQKTLLKFNKSGELITPDLESQLHQQAMAPFAGLQPGAVQAAPVQAQPAQPLNPPAFSGPAANQQEAIARDQQLSKLLPSAVQPKAAAPAAQAAPTIQPAQPSAPLPVGATVSGLGMSLGGDQPEVKMTAEQQKGLSQAALTQDQFKELERSFKGLSAKEPWLTGPVVGRIMEFTHPENWNANYASFDRAKTAILANLAKGIYHETGVLSDKDIERYGKAMPTVKDTPEAAQQKLIGVQKDIFSSIARNIETMEGQGQGLSPMFMQMKQSALDGLKSLGSAQGTPAQAGAAGPVIQLPTGRKLQRDANGTYQYVN